MIRYTKAICLTIFLALSLCMLKRAGAQVSVVAEPSVGAPSGDSNSSNVWMQWRGGNRDGHFHGAPWPLALDESKLEQTWRIELGPSYSGPIVTDKFVFTTETKDKKSEWVHALDRNTGEIVWSQEWEGAMKVPFFAKANGSWIRATPACDGETLFVAGIRDVLVALDAGSGEQKWRVDFVEKMGTPVPSFGCVSSPLLTEDHVYVQAGASFVKMNKHTGEIVWRTSEDAGGMNGGVFSSPTLETINGKPMLLIQTRTELKGIDIDSGKELWSHEIKAFRGMNILTPTVFQNAIFTSAHSGSTQLWNINKSDSQYEIAEAWRHKAQAYMSSPVFIGDHAYMHLKNQRFNCIELSTGEEKWRSTGYGKYASLVANGDKIIALDERGDLLLINATPEKFDLIDSRHVSDDPTWAHLAVVDGQLIIRELNAIAAYSWK